jgi:hypothetical protein
VTGWWFSPVSSTNKTYPHNVTEILLKVVKENKFNSKEVIVCALKSLIQIK